MTKAYCLMNMTQKHLCPSLSIQSHLPTHQLQNSSNPVLTAFWQEKNVSALSAWSIVMALTRTYESHDAAPQEKMLHQSLLSWYLSQVLERINNKYRGTIVFWNKLGNRDVWIPATKKESVCIWEREIDMCVYVKGLNRKHLNSSRYTLFIFKIYNLIQYRYAL